MNFANNLNMNFKGNPTNNNFYNQILQKKFVPSQDTNWNLANSVINGANELENSELKPQIKPSDEAEKPGINSEKSAENEDEKPNKASKINNSEENLVQLNPKSNKNSDNKLNNEFRSELNNSVEIDTDIGSNIIKVDTVENQEASPIGSSSKEEDKANNANTQESSSSKILIKDLINYNVNFNIFIKFFYLILSKIINFFFKINY